MSLIIQPKRWSIQPPLGVQISWGHPLSKGLVVAYLGEQTHSGNVLNLAANKVDLGTGTSWQPGLGLYCPSTSGAGVAGSTSLTVDSSGSTGFSVTVGYVIFDTSVANRRAVQGSNNWLIGPYQNGNDVFDGNTFLHYATEAIKAGVPVHITATVQSLVGTICYSNGLQVASTANYNSMGTFSLGAAGAFNEPMNGYIKYAYGHQRVLSPAEVLELYLDPYCFLQPQSPQRRFWVSAAPVVNTDPPFGVIGQPTPHYSPNIIVV